MGGQKAAGNVGLADSDTIASGIPFVLVLASKPALLPGTTKISPSALVAANDTTD